MHEYGVVCFSVDWLLFRTNHLVLASIRNLTIICSELLNETLYFWGQTLGPKSNKYIKLCSDVASLFHERSWNTMLLHSLKHVPAILCVITFFIFSSTDFSTSSIKLNFLMQNQFVFSSIESRMLFNLSFYLVSISWTIEKGFHFALSVLLYCNNWTQN